MSSQYDRVKSGIQAQSATWLVTGAAGFIGSHLVENLLLLGQRVIGLDNFATGYAHNLDLVRKAVGEKAQNLQFIQGDITNLDTCTAACKGVQFVLHQAALGSVPRSVNDPLSSHQANVNGFVNMLLGARDAGVKRFVYASSSSVYGDSAELPKVESRIGNPLSPYAVTKKVNEIYADNFSRVYGMETIGLRYFNVFGPRQDPKGAYAAVIPRWIAEIRDGANCKIYGDGETSRDFCYVANVVQANILAACAEKEATGQVYNVAVGGRTTLKELYRAIAEEAASVLGKEVPKEPVFDDFRKGDVQHSLANIGLAQEYLGYSPTHDIKEGLTITVKWFLAKT